MSQYTANLAYPVLGQVQMMVYKIWSDIMPLTLSGAVWCGLLPTKNCCRAYKR